MKKCNCHSYNWGFWETKEVILNRLVWESADWEKILKEICIDACISETIKHLWKEWVNTESSCCWHNILEPHIVFSSIEDAVKWRDLLRLIDKRQFQMSYWARVNVQ